MKNVQGYVLLIVLLFLQLFLLLSFGTLEEVILDQKLLSDQKGRRQLLKAAENQMESLLPAVSQWSFKCLNACIEKRSPWIFSYVVETLGVDPCAIIRGSSQTQAAYYRLKLRVTREKNRGQTVFLQATVVSESSLQEHCEERLHSVDLGPQSWQELF